MPTRFACRLNWHPREAGGVYRLHQPQGSYKSAPLLWGLGLTLMLWALWAAPAAAQPAPPQPTNLVVAHRNGQTFLTWTEVASLSGEAYHIYRHTAPITAATLAQATQLTAPWGPVGEGSAAFDSDRERGGGGSTYPGLRNYIISDLGPQLSDGVGLFVWTPAAGGPFYYAVTTVQSGIENRSSFSAANSLAGPVAEGVADPQPVLVWQSPSGRGRVYTQFLDLAGYNPTFGAARAQGYVYAYNYALLQPDPAHCPGGVLPSSLPLYLYLQGWGGRYEVEEASPYWCAVALNGDDPWQTWYYGHSASTDYRQEDPFASSGPIVNFTEQRLLRAIYDTLRSPGLAIDPQRIFVYGQSMGGSGALALGLRYPNVFAAAHAGQPMTNFRTSGDGGGGSWRSDVDWKWGSVAANLPIENRGRYAAHLAAYNGQGVWDWQNHQGQLLARRADETAFISLDHGVLDMVLEWSTQGRLAYEPFYLSRRAFSGAAVEADHTWLGFAGLGPTMGDVNWTGPFYGFRAVRNETLPGLTYGSGSGAVPPPGPVEYNDTLEWSASWNAWDGPPSDAPAFWRISLRSTDGSSQTVDVTPRRVQALIVTPGAAYAWENRRVSDNGLVAAGQVYADADGLVTVPAFLVTPGGNRLILQPAGGPTATPTATGLATATPTPTPSRTPTTTPTSPAGATATATPTPISGDAIVFQQGVSPGPAYDGAADTVLLSDFPGINFGGVDHSEVFWAEGEMRRSLLRWELTGLPAGAQVRSAHIELYREDGDASSAMPIALYRVTRAWMPGTQWELYPGPGYQPDGATWQIAAPGIPWSALGGDFDQTSNYGHGANGILDQITLAAGQANGWISLDATAAVRGWGDGSLPNYGLLLRPLGGTFTYHYFTASEGMAANQRPRLVIYLGDDCPADLDGDGQIDLADILLATAGWGMAAGQPGFNPALDVNGDGHVDVIDVQLVAARFNLTCAEAPPIPTVTATPTPTGVLTNTPTATPTHALTITPTPTATSGAGGAARPWPDSNSRIQVFNDQLASSMSPEQIQFAATHYAGTQKMTRSQANALRAVNPAFLILHYRLGHGLGYRAIQPPCQPDGAWLHIIDGDWVQEWPGEAALSEPWFYHWPENSATRVLNCDWGWYLMDVSQPGYRSWWIGQVLGQLAANDNDGIFADSLSVPNYLGHDHYSPALPAVNAAFEAAWTQRIEDWIDYLQGQLGGRYYFVPNAGAWVNGRDATDYSAADGVMIEGFAEWGPGDLFDLDDWRLQMNRALGLIGQGRAVLAQSYVDPDNVPDRLFQLGVYLLIKGGRTYINFELDLEPEWFPEYDIDLGAPLDPLPATIDDLRQANGLYRRRYARGEVWVNPDPAGSSATATLGTTRWLATPQGGGFVPANGVLPASWRVNYSPVTAVTLAPGQAAILLNSQP